MSNVVIKLPDGYANAMEFAKDCGFEIIDAMPLHLEDFMLLMAERFDKCGKSIWSHECRNAARAIKEWNN